MAKSSSSSTVSKDLPRHYVDAAEGFLLDCGNASSFAGDSDSKDFYSNIIRDLLKTQQLQQGRISCVFSVLPAVTNIYNGALGGAIGAIAERMGIACARSLVGEDKELFVGELSMSYLSAAKQNEVVVAEGCVVRSGRNITVVAIQFRIKETCKLVYTARATLYHLPIAKL